MSWRLVSSFTYVLLVFCCVGMSKRHRWGLIGRPKRSECLGCDVYLCSVCFDPYYDDTEHNLLFDFGNCIPDHIYSGR